MRIEDGIKLDFKDVLIRPKRSELVSRKDVELERSYTFVNKNASPYKGIPIMASNMDGVGTLEVAKTLGELGLFTCLVKTYTNEELVDFFGSVSEKVRNNTAVTIGISDKDIEEFEKLYAKIKGQCSYLCVEVANGYTERFALVIARVRKLFPNIVIIAGNVVTADQTQELILSGADIIKVGIGPGSVCTTRIKTGVGYPQLSAIIECADAAHGLNGRIIADGGCTSAGDVAKAFAAGSDFVMLGGLFAGHEEGGGDIITRYLRSDYLSKNADGEFENVIEERKFIEFYGMSSHKANEKHFGGLKDYRSSEGREVVVPFRGKIKDTVQDICGGLRSACTYVGASNLKQLSKCTTFIRVSQQYNPIFEKSK